MAKNDNLPEPNENDIRSQFEDERTQARIQEHLNNEHDVITEEDIANIQIGASTPEETIVTRKNDPEEDLPGEKADDQKDSSDDPAIETPWNILEP